MNKIHQFILGGTIVFLGLLFNGKYLNDFPSYIHAWSQSDRYALSLGFVNNGLNLCLPETFSCLKNHPDGDQWKFPTDQSITAVDFPLHDYLPALFMKLFGNTAPFFCRTYLLLMSFLGLFYLFKLTRALTNDVIKSLFMVVFAATSPLFIYYQAGFLPSIPSLTTCIIGMYFYVLYLKGDKKKSGMRFSF